jgi:LysM repeat protein
LKQKLIIPISSNKSNSSNIRLAKANTKTTLIYKVKNGDTLYSIARKYNIDLKKLMSDNELKSNFINIGDKIVIKK